VGNPNANIKDPNMASRCLLADGLGLHQFSRPWSEERLDMDVILPALAAIILIPRYDMVISMAGLQVHWKDHSRVRG
jgi:hypothetical protein